MGYGGTKTEMERLLADAEKLSGVKYDINNLGDVYDAIHVIQGDLGLTGVAAQEASETFSGSFNAMKASAANFFGSLALGENVSASLGQLMTSASTFFFGNFIPMLGTIISSLPGAIATFFAQGVPLLLSNVSTLVQTIATNIKTLADGVTGEKVAAWASTTLPKIIATAASLIGQFAQSLLTSLPKIVAAIARIGLSIVQGLGSALWGKVSAAAAGIRDRFMQPINALRDKVKAAIDKIKAIFSGANFKLPHIKLPHFKISGKFSLHPPQVPHLDIDWYKTGGIFASPSVIGVGEAGPEAVVPLDTLWKKLDNIANNAQQNQGGVVININGYNKDQRRLAEEVARILIRDTKYRRMAWL